MPFELTPHDRVWSCPHLATGIIANLDQQDVVSLLRVNKIYFGYAVKHIYHSIWYSTWLQVRWKWIDKKRDYLYRSAVREIIDFVSREEDTQDLLRYLEAFPRAVLLEAVEGIPRYFGACGPGTYGSINNTREIRRSWPNGCTEPHFSLCSFEVLNIDAPTGRKWPKFEIPGGWTGSTRLYLELLHGPDWPPAPLSDQERTEATMSLVTRLFERPDTYIDAISIQTTSLLEPTLEVPEDLRRRGYSIPTEWLGGFNKVEFSDSLNHFATDITSLRLGHRCGANIVSARQVITDFKFERYSRLNDLAIACERDVAVPLRLGPFNPWGRGISTPKPQGELQSLVLQVEWYDRQPYEGRPTTSTVPRERDVIRRLVWHFVPLLHPTEPISIQLDLRAGVEWIYHLFPHSERIKNAVRRDLKRLFGRQVDCYQPHSKPWDMTFTVLAADACPASDLD